MTLAYLLTALEEAVANDNYSRQSHIASLLIPFEESGQIAEREIIDIINSAKS